MKKLFLIALAVACGSQQKVQQQGNASTGMASQVKTDKKFDAKVEAKIRKFYKDCVFGDKYISAEDAECEAIIHRYCTDKLAQYLKDHYDYDDFGQGATYAIWEFRSDSQDSVGKSVVYSVDALGGGKYRVSFNDGGTKGSCVLTVVTDGDNIKFDEISERQET